MELVIKNMVCRHCVDALRNVLQDSGFHIEHIEIGKVVISNQSLDKTNFERLDKALAKEGFERVTDNDSQIVEAVKLAVLHHVRDEQDCKLKLSACIESHAGIRYDQASRIFSALEGRTIERYAILQKIEWVKELLSYGEHTLTEIAFRTGYSGTAHLSRQFKDVTGMTPTKYMSLRPPRKPINEV